MPMLKSEKEARVEQITELLEGKDVVILSDFTGRKSAGSRRYAGAVEGDED